MSPVWTPEKVVGARGFEPPTPWSRTRCSTRLSHAPTGAAQAPCNASSENSRLAQLAQLCQRRDALETLTREDGLVENFHQVANRCVGVLLRCRKRAMTEQLLDGAQVSSVGEQVVANAWRKEC